MTTPDRPPGPRAPDKVGETADPAGRPQPETAEVESARMLENQAREPLSRAGLTAAQVRRLADEYIALDRGESVAGFIGWAKERVRTDPTA